MARGPSLKIYVGKEYVGAAKDYKIAAMFAAVLGEDTEIRVGHRVKDTIWRQGHEGFEAEDSYEVAEEVMAGRVAKMRGRA